MRFDIAGFGKIVDLGTSAPWSGEQLAKEVATRAAVLAARGIGRGDTVMIGHGGSAAFFADLFAVWSRSAAAACLNPDLTAPELATVSAFLQPKALLVARVAPAAQELAIPVLDLARERAAPNGGAIESSLDDDALILFTSGTTGAPKGVVHTFRSVLARVALNRSFIGEGALATALNVLPTHFGHGLIGNCLTPLMAGKTLVLAQDAALRAAGSLGALIDAHAITFMSSVPSFWKLALKMSPPPARGSLTRVHVGSAPLSARLWQEIAGWAGTKDVVNMYGITETANWLGGASAADHEPADGLIGKLWGGTAVVRTAQGDIAACGEGELLVQSPSLMRGYLNRPELTREVLRDGWYHTGDIGRIAPDGTIHLVGRVKYEINRGGLKVNPEDIDLLLERHAAVREACAFAIPDKAAGETVGVAVCLESGAHADAKSLQTWCRERLVREKVPEKWFIVNEIPKTERGKVNRDAVAKSCIG